MTIREALAWAKKGIEKASIPSPEEEAAYLLCHALGVKRHELYLSPDKKLADAEKVRFMGFIERRMKREPSQYITGGTEFMGFPFKVTRATLIPRPETELLVEEAVTAASREPLKDIERLIIIDLCTGSGCIAVSVARLLSNSFVYATDISGEALKIAQGNAAANGVASRMTLLKGSLFEPFRAMGLDGAVHMILSNPPYVAEGEWNGLQPEVRDYEPRTALSAGADGFLFFKTIIPQASPYLIKGGSLFLEIGYGQAESLKRLLADDGSYTGIEAKKDLSGIERVLTARKK